MVDISWFGGLLEFTIPTYVIIGVILIIVGVLLGAFVPKVGKKFGTITFIVGLVLAVAFPVLGELWQSDLFKILVIAGGVFAVIIYILFSASPAAPKVRRR